MTDLDDLARELARHPVPSRPPVDVILRRAESLKRRRRLALVSVVSVTLAASVFAASTLREGSGEVAVAASGEDVIWTANDRAVTRFGDNGRVVATYRQPAMTGGDPLERVVWRTGGLVIFGMPPHAARFVSQEDDLDEAVSLGEAVYFLPDPVDAGRVWLLNQLASEPWHASLVEVSTRGYVIERALLPLGSQAVAAIRDGLVLESANGIELWSRDSITPVVGPGNTVLSTGGRHVLTCPSAECSSMTDSVVGSTSRSVDAGGTVLAAAVSPNGDIAAAVDEPVVGVVARLFRRDGTSARVEWRTADLVRQVRHDGDRGWVLLADDTVWRWDGSGGFQRVGSAPGATDLAVAGEA